MEENETLTSPVLVTIRQGRCRSSKPLSFTKIPNFGTQILDNNINNYISLRLNDLMGCCKGINVDSKAYTK